MTELSINIEQPELTEAILSLASAVRYQGDNIASLMDAAEREATAVTNISNFMEAPKPTEPNLYGFQKGDRVALLSVGSLRQATVDPAAYTPAVGNIPVRFDNGSGDGWPARYCVIVDRHSQAHINALVPPKPGYGTPDNRRDRHEWNAEAIQAAITDGQPVKFNYAKPIHAWDRPGDSNPRERYVMPTKFESVSSNPQNQVVTAIDLTLPDLDGSSRVRTFRLDRITNHVQIDTE
jgi:hypothetical protein